jgi:glycosyltransferase involved in cell wall biosynthesis
MSAKPAGPRILHLHSTFAAGGKELRCVRLINAFGPGVRHAIVSGDAGQMDAARHISGAIPVTYPKDFPSLRGRPTPGRLQRLARSMAGYDLVLTYNWGAMDAVMAHTLFADVHRLPPLIHHEDGFNADESGRLKARRNWYRRIALGRTSGLVVPSESLEAIALETWQQPIGRVKRIANGIDTGKFSGKVRADALRGLVKRKGELWLGTLAGLRPVKNLPRLVRAFAALPEQWQLVIVGEGEDKAAIRDEAMRLGVGHRLHLPGFAPDPARFVGLFDLFALSSDSEQAPISLIEAMAAGLPAAATDVGDVAEMVSPENRPYVVAGEDAFAAAVAALASDADLRTALGTANRERARSAFDEKAMIAAYRRLYGSALGDAGALG